MHTTLIGANLNENKIWNEYDIQKTWLRMIRIFFVIDLREAYQSYKVYFLFEMLVTGFVSMKFVNWVHVDTENWARERLTQHQQYAGSSHLFLSPFVKKN